MKKYFSLEFYLIIILSLSLKSAYADEKPSLREKESSSGVCATLTSTKEVLQCALQQHPLIQQSQIESTKASYAHGKAAAHYNPELATTTTSEAERGGRLWVFEGSLNQRFELGGKRSSRIEAARAEVDKASSSLQFAREQVFLETIHSLYRYRQIYEELELLNEATTAFQRVLNQYKERGRLSPEQEISSEIFSLALGEQKLRRDKLIVEETGLRRRLELILGRPLPNTRSYLPPFRKKWPALNGAGGENYESSSLKLAKSELRFAQAELQAAQALSWPDVTAGPVVGFDHTGPGDVHQYRFGFNVGLPLPLWNVNRSGRAYAEQGRALAAKNLEVTQSLINIEQKQLLEKYQSVITVMGTLADLKELEKKHSRVEKLFQQGLVSTSLYIEAHRQIQDFLQTRNESEQEANDALWKTYALEGRMFEENLWVF